MIVKTWSEWTLFYRFHRFLRCGRKISDNYL